MMPEKCLKRKERTYQSLSLWHFSADKVGSVLKLLQDETPTVRGLAADNNNKLYIETMIFL